MSKSRRYLTRPNEILKCQSKYRHDTLRAAQAHAKNLSEAAKIFVRVYKCPGVKGQPKHWHITTKPNGY